MREEKRATLSERIYYNEGNGYLVGVFESEEEQFFGVGILPLAQPGRVYRLSGAWKTHPKYGEQFAFSSFEEQAPETEAGLIAFLSSGLLKGVGPATAQALVDTFGPETLDVLANQPERLTQVPGVGKVRAAAMVESYRDNQERAATLVALQEYGIASATAVKLYGVYGKEALSAIKENPYRLIGEVYGIGFRRADDIARYLGFEAGDPRRLRSGQLYYLDRLAASGHTYALKEVFTREVAELLDVEREQVEAELYAAIIDGAVYLSVLDGVECLYLERFYRAEQQVAARLIRLEAAALPHESDDPQNRIRQIEVDRGIRLSKEQRQAILLALDSGVCVITGGPGTGKTTIISVIADMLLAGGESFALAAPTGRAAKRITQATGFDASTIHRLLEYYYSESEEVMRFGRNEDKPLEVDCLIVDELSMMDLLLAEGLLRALPQGTRLILVGDADQLPPVGAGSVLRDLLQSQVLPAVHLKEIFRQAQESMIVVNAHLINRGEYPLYNGQETDFFLLERRGEQEILATIKDLCTRRLPTFYGVENVLSDIQVLTPMRKGSMGSLRLNQELQAVLNPPSPLKAEKTVGERIFREGDKVMQTKNDYRISWKNICDLSQGEGVFNGDIGVIRTVDPESGSLHVLFDEERLVEYDFEHLDELESAFAMTVHKSQGSEFPLVVLPMSGFPPMLATRNLLYTAVTRARLGVVLVGSRQVCERMVDNDTIAERRSGLSVRLRMLAEATYED